MTHHKKVLFIGLDAAESSLVERWMADGLLPNMRRLRDRGLYTRIRSPHDHLVGLPWPTFYTGTNPGKNGAYHYLQWDPKTMVSRRLNRMRLPLHPFWRKFRDGDPRAIVIDVPLTTTPEPFNGVEIIGWGTHERLDPLSAYPPDTLPWVDTHICPAPAFEERYGPLTANQFSEIKDRLLGMTQKVTRLAQALMNRENWDLFIVVYSVTHRGGHQLWNKTNVTDEMSADEEGKFSRALQQVYVGCDRAVGELIDAAGEDATILVCSLHGMGVNHSRTELLPEMTKSILEYETKKDAYQRPRRLSLFREMIPSTWRHALKKRLPYKFQDALTSYWRMGGTDWRNTPVICLLGDYDGYLQVNLKGRETQGIVEPGKAYEFWVELFTEGLKSFVDADSGEPIVAAVLRREELGLSGECLERFPDMIVQWRETSAAQHRALVSPKYGKIQWPTPGRNPEGRSGNHRQHGFMLASGQRFRPNSDTGEVSIVDLAPTILDLMGLPQSPEMEGRAI